MKKILLGIMISMCVAAAGIPVSYASDTDSVIPEIVEGFEDAVYININEDNINAFHADRKNAEAGPEKIDEKAMAGSGILFYDRTLELGEGTFVLSGDLNGQILIDAGKKKDTVLVLDGLHVINPDDAAVYCKKAKSFTVILADGSENSITSGEEVEINEECINLTADSSGGALRSKADTVITGAGSLDISGYINNGIHVTKSLNINLQDAEAADAEPADAGTDDQGFYNLNIKAVNNGIKVKDIFSSDSGSIKILSGGDGVKAQEDAVEAQDAVIDEETGLIVSEAVEAQEGTGQIIINGGTFEIDSYDDGMQALLDLQVNSGNISVNAYGTYKTKGAYTKTHDTTFSAKGLKSEGTLSIYDGQIIINSYSDGLHSGSELSIDGGVTSIYCGDDGLHSDEQINIRAGIINISNSYEGIEANQINIDGGTVTVFAWDDGMNANGGQGSFGGPGGPPGRPGGPGAPGGSSGQQSEKATDMPNLIINGGDIYVNASGDGLDSNGNIKVTGGKTVVDGPTTNWNGPLDSGRESGGSIIISGGLVFAGGASGMAETFDRTSEQASFQAFLISDYSEGSKIQVIDPEGNVLLDHTAASAGNSVVFSCPELTDGETYVLKINDDSYEISLSGKATKVNLRRK